MLETFLEGSLHFSDGPFPVLVDGVFDEPHPLFMVRLVKCYVLTETAPQAVDSPQWRDTTQMWGVGDSTEPVHDVTRGDAAHPLIWIAAF